MGLQSVSLWRGSLLQEISLTASSRISWGKVDQCTPRKHTGESGGIIPRILTSIQDGRDQLHASAAWSSEKESWYSMNMMLSGPPEPWAGIGQSVQRLATGWTVRGSNPGGGEIFRARPDRPWGSPSLLYYGHRVFPGAKAAVAWRWPSIPSSAEVKERVELYLYSPSGPSWPVIGWTLPLPLPYPQSRFGRFGGKKDLLPLWKIESWLLLSPGNTLVTVTTDLHYTACSYQKYAEK